MSALHLVMSPYSLCAHDAAAMAGLLLGGRVITFLPRSLQHAGGGRREALESSGYRRVLSSVAWATPFVHAGVLATSVGDDDAGDDFARVRRRIYDDPSLSALRRFVEHRPGSDPGLELERLARDLTRAGPDPSISVPLAAALDALAERHQCTVLRADGPSLAQRTERARERTLFACSVPVLVQASTERLLETRRRLENELEPLRAAIEAATDGLADEGFVRDAAADYSAAYDAGRTHIERPEEDPDDPQTRSAEVVLTGVAHEADHALSCSALAAGRVTGRARTRLAPEGMTGRSLVIRAVGR